jgi:hypothetical protein
MSRGQFHHRSNLGAALTAASNKVHLKHRQDATRATYVSFDHHRVLLQAGSVFWNQIGSLWLLLYRLRELCFSPIPDRQSTLLLLSHSLCHGDRRSQLSVVASKRHGLTGRLPYFLTTNTSRLHKHWSEQHIAQLTHIRTPPELLHWFTKLHDEPSSGDMRAT